MRRRNRPIDHFCHDQSPCSACVRPFAGSDNMIAAIACAYQHQRSVNGPVLLEIVEFQARFTRLEARADLGGEIRAPRLKIVVLI